MSKTNYVPTTRSWARFTASFPSASPTSEVLPYLPGNFALGTVACSGTMPVSANVHITIVRADYWGNYQSAGQWDSGYTDECIQHPTGSRNFDMPPAWFNTVGSARLAYTDGSGSGVLATAAHVYSVELKS